MWTGKFSNVKLGLGSGIRIWIGIKGKVGSGSASICCRSTVLGEGKGDDANLRLGLLVFISSSRPSSPPPFFDSPPPTPVITPHLLWEERVLYTHRTHSQDKWECNMVSHKGEGGGRGGP
jgi:hypothetical protein